MTCRSSKKALEWILIWILVVRQGWHRLNGVQVNFVWELTLAKGLLCLSPIERLLVLGYKMVALK